jgi:ABC-type proline/glycine betaine transport system substrate-binding protein
MTDDEEYEYDPEQLQEERQDRLETLEDNIESLQDKLSDYRDLTEARQQMRDVASEKFEVIDPKWEYEQDDEWLAARKRFEELKFQFNKHSDEQQLTQMENKIERKQSELEQIKQEIEDNE